MEGWTLEQGIVLATLVASLVLFVTDALRYDAVAILVVLILASTGALSPEQAFAGFSSKAVVLIGSMYVFSAAIERAGITGWISRRLLAGPVPSEAALAFRVTLVAGLLSSILSNAAVVATLIPVIGTLGRKTGVPAARLLMPLSFGSLLGGMLTLIGTSKNIAVNGAIEQAGSVPFHLFDFTVFGLVLLAIGSVYFLGVGRWLLPRGREDETLAEHYQVPKFVTEILVDPNSGLINRTVEETGIHTRFDVTVLGLIRAENEATILAPGPYNRIRPDDILILQGEPEAILSMRKALELRERKSADVGETRLVSGDVQLIEAVVPATSSYVGRTLEELEFRDTTRLNCLAISKYGDVQPAKIGKTRLHVGDALLLQGHVRDIWRQHQNRELIILAEHQDPHLGRKAIWTLLLLLGFITLAASGVVALSVAALAGAVGLVLLRCVRPDDVRRTMNWSVLILIGGMLALGNAFHAHGLDLKLATWIKGVSGEITHPALVVGLLLLTTAALTQVISHVAAAVLMTPVAIELAAQLGMSDRALLIAVLTGASLAFMSPVAHQANAMVMGPGDYRYRDFLRVGTPLTLILIVAASVLVPVFWP